MNKAYLIAPLAGVIAFGGYYGFYRRSLEARLTAQQQAADLARTEKLRLENEAKVAAALQASQALAQRKQESAAQLRLDAARAQARFEAERRRDAEVARVQKLQAKLSDLQGEADLTRSAIAGVEQPKSALEQEQRFPIEHVAETEIDRDLYLRLLDEIAAAERRRPAAIPPGRAGRSTPD